MMKLAKIIGIILVLVLMCIAIAGMYKFNYLSGKPSYDVDGNKMQNSHITGNSDFSTLEVIGVYGEKDGESIELIGFDETGEYNLRDRYTAIVSVPNLGDNYVSLEVGDRVKIAGDYAESFPVQIFNITKITKLENPDKVSCEAKKGGKWAPQGKAQIPACVTYYSDGGNTCSASSECEGNCIKTSSDTPAVCEKTSSSFGCKITTEKFKDGEGILCVD